MTPLRQLRIANALEGISLVALLFVAMPLKYFAGMPAAVRVVGSAHGLLFLVFVAVLFRVAIPARWPLTHALAVFATAFVPFGALFLDRVLPPKGDDP